MVSYRSLRHIGLMTGVAAAAIMAAGVAWAASTCSATFTQANCPTGSCHVASGTPQCTVDLDAVTVTCAAYVLGGVGNTNADVDLTVRFASESKDADFRSRNGQLNVTVLSAGTPAGGPQISGFTYTLQFGGEPGAFITITEANCNPPL